MIFPDKSKLIIVTGYPKSGNTWLSRLLGSALNSPVGGLFNALSLSEEGLDRKGEFYIAQLHQRITFGPKNEHYAYAFNVDKFDGERVIHVIRDPRDVAISAMYYWQRDIEGGLPRIIGEMITGDTPFAAHGRWDDFVNEWEDWFESAGSFNGRYILVRYEDLLKDTFNTMMTLMTNIDIPPNIKDLEDAIYYQDFNRKRQAIASDGESRPYGKTIQLANLRKGVVGDWRNHFNRALASAFHDSFGETMQRMGYIRDGSWVNEVE